MKVVVSDLGALKELLKTVVNEALEYDVAPEVQIMLSENAQRDVYDAYKPFVYGRSYSLTDGAAETYDVKSSGDMKVEVSVNHPYGKLIEYGDGVDGMHYDYPYNRNNTEDQFLRPRPFYRHTKEQLENGKYKELMAQSLRAKGISIS